MKKIVNMCVGCASPGYPCLGDACENRRVVVYYCDECKYSIEGDVYEVDRKEVCEDCLKKLFKKDL